MLALVSTGYCFDFAAIDTGNANWVPTGKSVADITVLLKSEVNGLFKISKIDFLSCVQTEII